MSPSPPPSPEAKEEESPSPSPSPPPSPEEEQQHHRHSPSPPPSPQQQDNTDDGDDNETTVSPSPPAALLEEDSTEDPGSDNDDDDDVGFGGKIEELPQNIPKGPQTQVDPVPEQQPRDFIGRRLRRRHLLISDPLAALSSSGFSYVVVTATDPTYTTNTTTTGTGSDNASSAESIGASALSRIRTIQSAGEGPSVDSRRLKMLWDVLFWTVIAVVGTFALHLLILGVLRLAKRESSSVPKMLHLPRLELLVFMMTLPMIAAAGAGLLRSSSPGIVTIGVLFSVVLPFGFLATVAAFLFIFLLRAAVEQRRALYVLVVTENAQAELEQQLSAAASLDVSPAVTSAASSLHHLQHYSTESSPSGSLTAAMLRPDQRDSLMAMRSASSSSLFPGFRVASDDDANEAGPSQPPRLPLSDGFITATADGGGIRPLIAVEESSTPPAAAASSKSFLQRLKSGVSTWFLCPVFGFTDSSTASAAEQALASDSAAWLGRGKVDALFVKRYGCFFEDTHGPQVLRVRSRYDPSLSSSSPSEEVVGSGVLVPTTPAGTEGILQALQTFGIVFAVTKMVLFAVIINGPGGVNSLVQVLALLLVALLHILYLRLCSPYRLRVELAAEMVASACDLAIFVCGIALIAKQDWSTSEKHTMGVAMLSLQAIGFLVFISVRVALAMRTLGKTVGPAIKELLPRRLLPNRNTVGQFLSSSS